MLVILVILGLYLLFWLAGMLVAYASAYLFVVAFEYWESRYGG